MVSKRLLGVAALFGTVGLMAACGTASTNSATPISGGLGQGRSSTTPAKAALSSAGPANQAASNAVLQARGDQKLIQDASMGVQINAITQSGTNVPSGTVSGYFRGAIDWLISGLIDLTWGFPLLLLAVIVVGILQPGLTSVIVAVAVVNWAGFARIIRAETMSLREREFVEAARALGVPHWRIILRHVIPNTVGSTLIMSSYYVAYTVIAEAGLSFIGMGAQAPTPSLGVMIFSGRDYLYVDAWMAIVPGVAIALIVLGLNTLGDSLRDVFDPRLRRF